MMLAGLLLPRADSHAWRAMATAASIYSSAAPSQSRWPDSHAQRPMSVVWQASVKAELAQPVPHMGSHDAYVRPQVRSTATSALGGRSLCHSWPVLQALASRLASLTEALHR